MSKIQPESKTTSSIPLFREPHSNPIPRLLELIPDTLAVLDPFTLDKMNIVMRECGYTYSSNSIVLLLIADMYKKGLVLIEELTIPEVGGMIILIKKI